MSTRPAPLRPCVVKGCPWRGPDPYGCPTHRPGADDGWDRQWALLPDHLARRHQTRHRA